MKKFLRIQSVLLLSGLVLLSSCASIVSRSKYPVRITSSPSGARVSIENKEGQVIFTGETPTTVVLKSGAGFFQSQEYLVTFSKEGYPAVTVPITSSIDGWYFANLLLGGVIGMLIVDPLTGAMYQLDNSFLNADLGSPYQVPSEGGGAGESSGTPEMEVRTLDEIPEAWKEHLIPVKP